MLSNQTTINVPVAEGVVGSVAFSPNANLLYAGTSYHIFQYDMTVPLAQVAATQDTVGRYDYFNDQDFLTFYYTMQLAPNNKIYLCTSSSTRYYHIIDNPNVRGTGCNVINYGLFLGTYQWQTIPNQPYFPLGLLDGSPCDTLGIDNVATSPSKSPREGDFKVFPNPANDILNIEYAAPYASCTIIIYDILGRVLQKIFTMNLSMAFLPKTYQTACILYLCCIINNNLSAQNALSYSTSNASSFPTRGDQRGAYIIVPNKATYDFFFDFSNLCDDPIIKDMKGRLRKCLVCVDNNTPSCTRTNHTYTGVKVENACTNTYLSGTEFNNHTRGLWVFGGSTSVSNATLPQHDHKGNRWLNNTAANYPAGSAFYGAYLGNNNTIWTQGDPSDFLYNLNNADFAQLKPIRSTHPTTWFIDDPNTPTPDPTITCPTCASTGSGTGGNLIAPNTTEGFSAEEIAIAEKTIDFGAYEDIAQWEAEKALYEKVENYNGVIVEGSAIDVFRDSIENTDIKAFVEAKEASAEVFEVAPALKAQYNSYRSVADAYKQTLAYLDSLAGTLNFPPSGGLRGADSLTFANYEAQMTVVKIQLEATHAQLSQIAEQIETARDLKIDDALALNALLEEGAVYQYNKKAVTDIYLRTLAKGNTDLNALDWANIDLIAHQCPYAGGRAVYEARAILAAISDEIYDDHSICAAVGINARTANSNPSKDLTVTSPSPLERGGVRLYPNPTTSITRLFIPAEYQGSEISLTNTVGQTIQVIQANATVQTIDLNTEPTGVYFITLRKEGKIIYQNKIVKVD